MRNGTFARMRTSREVPVAEVRQLRHRVSEARQLACFDAARKLGPLNEFVDARVVVLRWNTAYTDVHIFATRYA
jgi:hypothetical protein